MDVDAVRALGYEVELVYDPEDDGAAVYSVDGFGLHAYVPDDAAVLEELFGEEDHARRKFHCENPELDEPLTDARLAGRVEVDPDRGELVVTADDGTTKSYKPDKFVAFVEGLPPEPNPYAELRDALETATSFEDFKAKAGASLDLLAEPR